MYKLLPQIEILTHALNSDIDDLEDDSVNLLYYVRVSQANLKMMFLVEKRDIHLPDVNREYETLKCTDVVLHGINERDKYLEVTDTNSISADCTIVNEIFKSILDTYGLKLITATFHDFEFFETANESRGFVFEDAVIYEKLKDLINQKAIKMMKNTLLRQL